MASWQAADRIEESFQGLLLRFRGRTGLTQRQLAERVGVPKEVLYRRKQGFALPLAEWFRHELKDMASTVLLEPRSLQRGYFNPQGVRQILAEHFEGRRDQSGRIWRLLMLELWHRNFLEAGSRESSPASADYAVSEPGGAG